MLKFIAVPIAESLPRFPISKHLMLKFIGDISPFAIRLIVFQNILCWSLSKKVKEAIGRLQVFQNILCWSLSSCRWIVRYPCRISKHLMLKFITVQPHNSFGTLQFQNILCWSLSRGCRRIQSWKSKFQNILCWSLSVWIDSLLDVSDISKHLMLKFIAHGSITTSPGSDFKTSYVEVYQTTPQAESEEMKKFQNILCWSLSEFAKPRLTSVANFKTSYVEVYPDFIARDKYGNQDFKTSYVEVYRCRTIFYAW